MLNHQLSNYHSIINQDVLRCVKWLISWSPFSDHIESCFSCFREMMRC
jgi:hypothetical protein